jgi:hypothetical protein
MGHSGTSLLLKRYVPLTGGFGGIGIAAGSKIFL